MSDFSFELSVLPLCVHRSRAIMKIEMPRNTPSIISL